ncbi:MAG: hypothetical protein ACO4CH_06170 [Saprospiraceae bacterium]
MEISFVKHKDIDRLKWDSCVHYANNGHLFGYSWYLDNAAEEWDGLVEGEYESVLPLIYKTSPSGKKILYTPNLVAAAGIYSVHVLSETRIEAFLSQIPDQYIFGTLRFLPGIRPKERTQGASRTMLGYRLYIQEPYETLATAYRPELTQMLEKASKRGLVPRHTPPKPEQIAAFYRTHHPEGRTDVKTFHALQRIMYNALHRGIGFASAINDHQGNDLAMNFFLFSHGKLLSLMPVSSKEGKKAGALEYLFDLMIQTQAGRPLILDFNTSADAHLPASFGAHHVIHHELGHEEAPPSKLGRWLWNRFKG